MANYATLKTAIQQVVKTNGNNEITGALLQQSLLAMIDSLGVGYQFMGIATPSTNPGTPDQNVFYIASLAGTYSNFNGIVLNDGEVALLTYNGIWNKNASGFASEEKLRQVANDVEGSPEISINLSQYDLTNGFMANGNYYTSGNYGLYNRTKFIPIDAYIGRTMEIVIGSGPATVAILKSLPDFSQGTSPLDFATGFDSIIQITGGISPYQFVVPQDANYLCYRVGDTRDSVDYSPSAINVLGESSKFYTKTETQEKIAENLENYYNKSASDARFATKNELEEIKELTTEQEPVITPVAVSVHTVDGSNGFWKPDGSFHKDNDRRATNLINVNPGETYLITTHIRPATISAIVTYTAAGVVVGTWKTGTGVDEFLTDEPFVVPDGVGKIGVNSCDTTLPTVKKSTPQDVFKAFTKQESDNRYERKGSVASGMKSYGVSWSVSDFSDLGERCFGADGLHATIGVGNTNGASDFDSIFPWSEMKRCNVKTNSNGAKIVTFEGETGFAIDGSNGDVFVRIPKFKTSRYIENGREYVVVNDGMTHPAFIENGVELDEIFVAAFEASIISEQLYSRSGLIPGNNKTGPQFLSMATTRGRGYTLADMRSIDAIWRLMAVEFGCRNSNRILGYGYSDYRQADPACSYLHASVNAPQSNTITGGVPGVQRARLLTELAVGNNITICDGTQDNIVAQRKITNVVCATENDNIVISFDGAPIDITTDMFFGNAPCDSNYCESIGNSYKLNWHTGRTNRPSVVSSQMIESAINPCRYRWIENPVGNVWQFLPDIVFNNRQMYMCDSILNYAMDGTLDDYLAKGDLLPLQTSNGIKNDVNTVAQPNYWITSLLNDIFARGSAFAKSFDNVHDGSITSVNGYGGYYYLNDGYNLVVAGGGFDHLWRSNILTFRAWINSAEKWYLYGARLMYKNI